jgi:hypothetical protein
LVKDGGVVAPTQGLVISVEGVVGASPDGVEVAQLSPGLRVPRTTRDDALVGCFNVLVALLALRVRAGEPKRRKCALVRVLGVCASHR